MGRGGGYVFGQTVQRWGKFAQMVWGRGKCDQMIGGEVGRQTWPKDSGVNICKVKSWMEEVKVNEI
jgi:hypothetical protein